MNDNVEQVVLEIDETPVIRGTDKANIAMESYSKKSITAIDKAGKAFENHGNLVVRTSDRTRNSVERLVQSAERLNRTYGQSPIDKEIARHEMLIQRLSGESVAADRARAAHEQLIAKMRAAESAGVSEARAATAALKGMETGFGSNNRAAAAFLTQTLGMGKVLQVAFPVFGAMALMSVVEQVTEKVIELKRAWDPVYQAEKRAMEQGKDLLKDFENTATKTGEAIRRAVELRSGEKGALKYDVETLRLTVASDDQTLIRQLRDKQATQTARAGQYITDKSGRQHLTQDALKARVELGTTEKELENATAQLKLHQLQLGNAQQDLTNVQAREAQEAAAEAERKANVVRAFNRRIDVYSLQQQRERNAELDKGAEYITKESEKEAKEQLATAEKNATLFTGRYFPQGMVPAAGFESMAQYSARTAHEERMAGITAAPGANQAGLAVQQANARLAVINTIRDREIAILDATRDAAQIAEIKAKSDLESTQVRYGLEEKIAELNRKQFDEIKGKTEGLLHTLFTNPRAFGGQLKTTLRDAMLHPIEDRLSTMIAGPIQNLFGGHRGIDSVQLVNGAVPVVVMGAGSGGGAGGVVSSAFSGLGRLGAVGALAGALAFGGGYSPRMSGGEIIGGGDSTAGLTQLSSGLWQRGPGAGVGGGFESLLGVGGTGGFAGGYGGPGARGNPLGGLLGGFKGINWGGFTRSGTFSAGVDENGNDVTGGGRITGVNGMAGAGLQAGGMYLAQRGLLGKDRGTWGGVGEGAAGGAMIGLQMGGPIGAVIGGIVGAGIGLGEKIAGVETPERQAARQIKAIWGLNIESNSTTIAQIVAMAKQNYGGNVSMAVRSPQVRELLQLYAESTGQRSSALTAYQVHSASLAQSGGSLYQTATYQNGTPYTYASSLPTLGPSGSVLPTSSPMGGPVTVNLSREQTVDLWRTGTSQAIQGDPRGVAQAAVNGNGASSTRLASAGQAFDPGMIWA